MKRKICVLLFVFFCIGLALAGQENSLRKPKVVVVSLDAAADWIVDDLLARGVLPPDGAFGRMARQGARAEAMIPISPSMTAPAHISMFTGAYPERTGIVSNSFLLAGGRISQQVSGFSAPIEAETLWHAAQRQGKRVICATAVGADNRTPDRNCDLTFGYGRSAGPAAVVHLARADAGDWTLGKQPFEHVRALEAATDSPSPLAYQMGRDRTVEVFALAVDRVFDGNEKFDAVVLDFDRDLRNGYAALLRAGEWGAAYLPVENIRAGSWMRALELAGDLSAVKVYLGAPGVMRGSPPEFLAEMESRFGFWPGAPDGGNRNRELISETHWWQQALRLTYYLRDVALANLQRDDWDLFFTYLPLIDQASHVFLLQDPRQGDYDEENGERRARYARHIEWAYQTADQILLEWMKAAPPETNFIVVSDHGMIPIHTDVNLNTLLAQAGFRVTRDDTTEVRAYTSGSSAHIYVNLTGRRPQGVVPEEKLEDTVARIVAACKGLRDPATGEPVLEVVLRRSELDQVRLNHPGRAGEVWVNARPGYQLRSRIDPEALLFSDNRVGGQHGFQGSNRKIQAIFYAIGPNVKTSSLGLVRQVDVAPTAAALLGIEPPKDNQGRAVLNFPR